MTFDFKSPAKINLTLDVLKRDSSGYHQIQTIYQKIELYDWLHLEKIKQGLDFNSNRPDLNDSLNTVRHAYQLLTQKIKKDLGVKIYLEKNIPSGSGLGGGSSNAAIFLQAVNTLYELGLSKKELVEIAKQIGMDVALFLEESATLFGYHYGELLQSLPVIPQTPIFLILPNFFSSTPVLYQSLDYNLCGLQKRKTAKMKKLITQKQFDLSMSAHQSLCHNDFEVPFLKMFPDIDTLFKTLKTSFNRPFSLSGTGAAFFLLTSAKEAINLDINRYLYTIFGDKKSKYSEFKIQNILTRK